VVAASGKEPVELPLPLPTSSVGHELREETRKHPLVSFSWHGQWRRRKLERATVIPLSSPDFGYNELFVFLFKKLFSVIFLLYIYKLTYDMVAIYLNSPNMKKY